MKTKRTLDDIPRASLVIAAAETGLLYGSLKARCQGGAFISALDLTNQLQVGNSLDPCRVMLDNILDAPGDALDRGVWRLSVYRIEQALGLDHHPVAAAAHAAQQKGPDHWATYIRDIRQAVTAEG